MKYTFVTFAKNSLMDKVLSTSYRFLMEKSQSFIKNLTLNKVSIGVNLTLVQLSDGSIGVSSTLFSERIKPHKCDRYFGEFSPSKIKGQKVSDLMKFDREGDLYKSLKMAVINAISASFINNDNYKVLEKVDPIDLLEFKPGTKVSMVGAFRSYIDKISETQSELKVLELNEGIMPEMFKKYYYPAEEYKKVIPESDIVIITGLTLVNNTIDGLLNVLNPKSKVVVVGPSANIIPDILFEKGVDIIGATKYENPDLLFQLVNEGASAYHLFQYCAKKICIVNE